MMMMCQSWLRDEYPSLSSELRQRIPAQNRVLRARIQGPQLNKHETSLTWLNLNSFVKG